MAMLVVFTAYALGTAIMLTAVAVVAAHMTHELGRRIGSVLSQSRSTGPREASWWSRAPSHLLLATGRLWLYCPLHPILT